MTETSLQMQLGSVGTLKQTNFRQMERFGKVSVPVGFALPTRTAALRLAFRYLSVVG